MDGSRSAARESLPLLEAWTTLSALTRDTTRLRLGTSVLRNSYRHRSVLAKMAATLDVISGGRLDLGLGAGWFEREFDAYGRRVSLHDSARRGIRLPPCHRPRHHSVDQTRYDVTPPVHVLPT